MEEIVGRENVFIKISMVLFVFSVKNKKVTEFIVSETNQSSGSIIFRHAPPTPPHPPWGQKCFDAQMCRTEMLKRKTTHF